MLKIFPKSCDDISWKECLQCFHISFFIGNIFLSSPSGKCRSLWEISEYWGHSISQWAALSWTDSGLDSATYLDHWNIFPSKLYHRKYPYLLHFSSQSSLSLSMILKHKIVLKLKVYSDLPRGSQSNSIPFSLNSLLVSDIICGQSWERSKLPSFAEDRAIWYC